VVVLGAQVEVAQQDGRLRTRDDQDDEDEEKETVHVIDLAAPDAVKDEEELYEDAAEGQDAAHDDPWDRLGRRSGQGMVAGGSTRFDKCTG